MLSLYIEESSWLHRQSAGHKLGVMALCSIGLFWASSTWLNGAALLMVFGAYRGLGQAGLQRLTELMRGLLPMLVVIGLAQWLGHWINGVPADQSIQEISKSLLQLVALIAMANLVSITTPIGEMVLLVTRLIQAAERAATRIGVGGLLPADTPRAIGLGIGMLMRQVGLLSAQWPRGKDILIARGIRPRMGLRLVWLMRAALSQSAQMEEALRVRRLLGQDSLRARPPRRSAPSPTDRA